MSSPLPVEHSFPHMSSPAGDCDYEYEKYFDFEAYVRDQNDGALHHHHHNHPRSSEGSIHTPALTADSTMSPLTDHLEYLDGQYATRHLNSLPDVQHFDDEWTYPSSDPSQGSIHDFTYMLNSNLAMSSSSSSYSSSPPSSASSPPSSYPPSPPSLPQSSSSSRRGSRSSSSSHSHSSPSSTSASSSTSGKSSKKRHLHRPEHTAEVRENGACIRCRIRRVRCDLRICEPCKKFQYLCIHEQLSTIGPVFNHISHRYAETIRRDELTGRTVQAPITFSETDPYAPEMNLCIQAYRVEKGKPREGPNCAIPREAIPSWDELSYWAGRQLLHEEKAPFPKAIETFIIRYSSRQLPRDHKMPKFELVDRVRQLTCMFKIWMTQHSSYSNDGIYYRGSKSKGPERLPYSVHEELRHIAKKAMESLERDILRELDTCMTQSGAVKPYEKPLLWACLWQLIFVYRQVLMSSSSHPGFQRCTDVAGRLYTALVAYYTGFFNTPKSLQLELDLTRSKISSRDKTELSACFRYIIDQRLDFYNGLKFSARDDLDVILSEAIADNELKRLQKRKSRKGHASVRGSTMVVDIVEDGDEDEEMGGYY
ncbi:uncharacterized protein DNG_00300 [Cephalotrichum gorgonifer]|uniref:Zn(2)-C6 fungal-type domain-containing protein n=1 Tax=Cephalotrichum gorgonifer TaxID=2041049 RepID=A0AAE8MQK6_9PEZI|nr:uncharacterized protein DNG_00300 [Cephalotrichum gorgonifer]